MRIAFTLCTLILLTAGNLLAAADLTGFWLTVNDKSVVKISKEGETYAGRIIWLREPNNKEGLPKIDKNNSDEKLRSRPVLGLALLEKFVAVAADKWEKGTIYNPEDGKLYSCILTLKGADTLEVHGYVLGLTFLGKTQIWHRTVEPKK